jgi:hypothetical protein
VSDQRFDEDLRSVLLEDAPGEVPDDLRRRVAAVASTPPAVVRPSRPAWRHPVPLWIGAAAALVVVLAVLSWRFGPAPQPGVGGASSSPALASLSTAPSSGALLSPSSTPAPSISVSACRARDLQGQILGWQGAAGSRIAPGGVNVEDTNTSASPCHRRGTPGLELVDAGGRVLIDSATAGPSGQPRITSTDTRFVLAPGGRLRTDAAVSNYCGAAPLLPIDIAFTLPSGGGRFIATPGPGVSSAEATPPCLGSAGSQITMNGWRN